ncbi:Senecionine N-oxygenase [Blastocladiella emersonii ATCC 22665]|nr:Senecionine N-oxygenase [Blastocladiella emersonii ATCC 22665]
MTTTTTTSPLRIGVLALQGAFIEHIHMLERVGRDAGLALEVFPVKTTAQLEDPTLHGLVMPGGESTAIALVAERSGCLDALRNYVQTRPTWGTCAGMILLSKTASATKQGGQTLLGALDITVERNAFGKQADSFVGPLEIEGIADGAAPFSGVFIRAPVVSHVGESVAVIGRVKGPDGADRVVAVHQGHLLGTSFHPELTPDTRVHKYFVDLVREFHARA